MTHTRTFPSGYTKEELADEIARLYAVLDQHYVCFERMVILADRIKGATTERDRLKDTHRMLCLVQSAAQTLPELLWDLHPVIQTGVVVQH